MTRRMKYGEEVLCAFDARVSDAVLHSNQSVLQAVGTAGLQQDWLRRTGPAGCARSICKEERVFFSLQHC